MTRAKRIAALNDSLRTAFLGGKVVMTAGVAALPKETLARVLSTVRTFSAFTEENDPYGEHDFGAFDLEGEKFFWKIDCYDAAMEYGSEDPTDPAMTTRVLTILLASEY